MNKIRNAKLFLIAAFIFLFSANTLKAQATLEPLRFNSSLYHSKGPSAQRGLSVATDTIPVGLPFFDDFAGEAYRNHSFPAASHWVQGGGAYINNTYPVEPPSYNVATLDGLKEDGTAYNFTSSNIQGITDVLTSRPIRLDTISPDRAQSVYLSFYWQAGSSASQLAPNDMEDSLYLEFKVKDSSNTWKGVWSVAGQTNAAFKQAIVQVPPAFHSSNFQFRFVNFGQMNGNFDIWHVDYIYLNSGRHAGDTLFANREEFAVSRKPGKFLQEYSAMPYKQFQAAPNSIMLDSINTYVNLLGASITPFRYEATLSENIRQSTAATYRNIPFPNPVTPSNFARQLRYTIPIDQALLKSIITAPSEIEYKFYVTEQPAPAYPFLLHNDTARTVVHFKDYLAYDDGNAELSYSVGGNFSQTAVKYNLYRPDTITHLSIHFTKMVDNIESQPFTIAIWKHLRGVDNQSKDSIIARMNVSVNYSTELNGFTQIPFSEPVAVTDSFYIGWQQSQGGSRSVNVGFDLNNPSEGKIWQNYAGAWEPFRTPTPGALMLRPIFKNDDPIASAKVPDQMPVTIFPNPATDLVHISGVVERVLLYDVAGKLLISQQFSPNTEKQLNTSALKPGIYVLRLFDKQNKSATRKLIINK